MTVLGGTQESGLFTSVVYINEYGRACGMLQNVICCPQVPRKACSAAFIEPPRSQGRRATVTCHPSGGGHAGLRDEVWRLQSNASRRCGATVAHLALESACCKPWRRNPLVREPSTVERLGVRGESIKAAGFGGAGMVRRHRCTAPPPKCYSRA